MEIRIETKEFIPSLAQVASVVMAKNTLPILECVIIDVNENGDAKLTASDGEIWLSVKTKVLSCDQATTFCLPANDFLKALRNLGETEVTMRFDQEKKIVACSYGNGEFALPYQSAEDYPQSLATFDNAKDFILDAVNYVRAIEKVDFAVGNDDLRPIVNGVNFDFTNNAMISVAMDGLKLAKYCDSGITHEDAQTYSFVLPAKPAAIVKSILENIDSRVKIVFNDSFFAINNSEFKLTTRLLEGRYLPYNNVIPKPSDKLVVINKEAFTTALKRVALMSSAKSGYMALRFAKNNVVVSAEDVDFSRSANEEVMCEYDGEEMTIGFNSAVIASVVANCETENVTIELNTPQTAVIVRESNRDEYLSLVMPMAL